jgi:hypothetical protein
MPINDMKRVKSKPFSLLIARHIILPRRITTLRIIHVCYRHVFEMTTEIKHYISGPKTENGCMYWVEMSTLLTAVLPPGREHIPPPKGNVSINTVICNTKWYAKSMNLTLSWRAGHVCPTYKESFQVRWDNSIPLFLHAAIYLEVPL